jgi:hexokinase
MQFTSQTKTGAQNTVYVIQDIPGTKIGTPKINIIGATQYGQLKVLLPENSQIILSPAYVITTLKQKLKDYKSNDYLLLTGDPAIIGVACSIVFPISQMENINY